uniref:RING-type E3 ubiquitin transferase n=1 Tax=Phlebotomus papatasi TaxID=29031 RepID=A0A1B0DNB3_PHLPP
MRRTIRQATFFPCICSGSIKWIHQDCLMQWMRYSRKEFCELCGHRFSFTPIYSPDMPRVLPLRDVAGGLVSSIATAVKYWLHYTLVALAWLGVVPFTAYRTYRFLFSASYDMLLSLPINMFSTENIAADVFRGCFVVTCTLFSFIGLVWLREQILHGGGPDWLERDDPPVQEPPPPPNVEQDENLVEANNNINNNNNNNDVQQNVEANLQVRPAHDNGVLDPQMPFMDNPINREEPPVADPDEPEIGQEVVGDEANWNPMEWDRAAEELTWERLLGLDGSMVFLEHVFWVISLNTLFIFIFAFCPYTIGNMAIFLLGILKPGKPQMHFHGLLTTLLGYCIIGITLVKLHALAKMLRMRKSRRILGLCYIVVKVSLLSVVEIGVLPLVCGWWLDICSLPMFDATLKDRKASFKAAPGTSLFIHWMFGMVYVYYFASFIILLREVLRPGVLWFLRNLNDPDFSPIQEMIHFSILRHIRRLVASAVIFGSAVLLMLWLPINILKNIWPTFLPYTLSGDSEIILPGFFEQSQTRVWLKGFIRIWCSVVSWFLGIRSYLLGSDTQQQNAGQDEGHRHAPDAGQGLGAAHQALLHRDVPVGFQPYDQPSYFILRLAGLIVFMCVSLVIGSLLTLTIPVWIGRQCMTLWLVGGHIGQTPTAEEAAPPKPHELYTAAMGTYLCWIISRGIAIAVNLFPQGRQAVVQKIKHWMSIGASYAMAAVIFVLMFGVVPLLYGLLLELVVVVPLRVPLEQTPILFLGQDWALGVLYTKITCALTLMGPDWALKRAIERAYRDGLRDIDLKFIIKDLAAPVIMCFGLALAVPYVLAHSILPIFFTNQHTRTLLARRIYPFFLIVAIVIGIIVFQIRQFKKLYVAIKNDKYLVGQRLVNYDHLKRKASMAPSNLRDRT